MRAADSARVVHLCAYSQARIFAHKWPTHALRLTQALDTHRMKKLIAELYKLFFGGALVILVICLLAVLGLLLELEPDMGNGGAFLFSLVLGISLVGLSVITVSSLSLIHI